MSFKEVETPEIKTSQKFQGKGDIHVYTHARFNVFCQVKATQRHLSAEAMLA